MERCEMKRESNEKKKKERKTNIIRREQRVNRHQTCLTSTEQVTNQEPSL